MICLAEGQDKTAHYAICTGFMALGMMLPGMWSGALQTRLAMCPSLPGAATIPSLVMTALLRIPEGFGRRRPHEPTFLSLDAFRGFTIAAMLLVNNRATGARSMRRCCRTGMAGR